MKNWLWKLLFSVWQLWFSSVKWVTFCANVHMCRAVLCRSVRGEYCCWCRTAHVPHSANQRSSAEGSDYRKLPPIKHTQHWARLSRRTLTVSTGLFIWLVAFLCVCCDAFTLLYLCAETSSLCWTCQQETWVRSLPRAKLELMYTLFFTYQMPLIQMKRNTTALGECPL